MQKPGKKFKIDNKQLNFQPLLEGGRVAKIFLVFSRKDYKTKATGNRKIGFNNNICCSASTLDSSTTRRNNRKKEKQIKFKFMK